MKKFLLLLCIIPSALIAQVDSIGKEPISLKAYAEYGYNYVWQSYGQFAVSGYFPINKYFDLEAGLNAATSNVYALDARAIVKFPLKHGQLNLENRILYRAYVRNMTNDLCGALSLGYRMDYFAVSVGGFCRIINEMLQPYNSSSPRYVVEPFNIMWNIEGHVRRESDFWNLGLRISNYDEYTIDRFNQFIFTLVGRYRPIDKLQVFAEVACKPAGVFNISANFFGINARAGIIYSFK